MEFLIGKHLKRIPMLRNYLLPILLPLMLASNLFVAAAQETQPEVPLVSLTTAQGNQLQIFSQLRPLSINQIHSWELLLTDANGNLLENPEVSVIGGMPEHDHGLPTLPRVTDTLSNGRQLLQGVRFHMPGLWQLDFTVKIGDESDSVRYSFTL